MHSGVRIRIRVLYVRTRIYGNSAIATQHPHSPQPHLDYNDYNNTATATAGRRSQGAGLASCLRDARQHMYMPVTYSVCYV